MYKTFYLFAILSIFVACATPSSPEGGPRDSEPPSLITEKSSASLQTNEDSRSWHFEFDEFVKLDNPAQNILVSPPLTYPLETRVYGKTVKVRLDDREQLQENTTYIINFGRAIKDITEGNSTTGLQHIFSTGPVIDSLSIRGSIIRAYDGEPVSEAAVLLYDNLRDSSFLLEKPLYLSFPDSSGYFELNYLRSDSFRLFALKDQNANLRYDGPPEALAFYPDTLLLDSATIIDTPLILFEEESTPRLEDYAFASGLLTLDWSHAFPDTPDISFSGLNIEYREWMEKEIKIWYLGEPEINSELYIKENDLTDTIKLRYTKSQDQERQARFFDRTNKLPASHEAAVELSLQVPVTEYNTDSIFFLHDTLILPPEQVTLTSPFSLEIQLPGRVFEKGGILIMDNGALEAFRGARSDSTNIIISPFDKEELGNLFVIIDTLNPDIQYIVEFKKKDDDWRHREIVKGASVHRDSFFYLQPGVYEVEVIEDLDSNSRWSSGRYFEKILPEKVFRAELEELKSNWELEANVKVNPILKPRREE